MLATTAQGANAGSHLKQKKPWVKFQAAVAFGSRGYHVLLSEKTFNTLAFVVFYAGSFLHVFPIHPPKLEAVGQFGQIVVLKGRFDLLDTIVQTVACGGLLLYFSFEILQMINLVPKLGFTFQTIFVIFYFVATLLEFMVTYVMLKHRRVLVTAWNNIEWTTKCYQRNGAHAASQWKRSIAAVSMLLGAIILGIFAFVVVMVIFIYRPNYPFHIFHLLPEAWKPVTAVYLVMVAWQAFVIIAAISSILCMLTFGIGLVFGITDMINSAIRVDIRSNKSMTPGTRVKLYRMVQLLNQMADEVLSNFFLPLLVFFTIAGGVLFTHICLTKYDSLDFEIFAMIAMFDAGILGIISTLLLQCGKYQDAAKQFIWNIKMSIKEQNFLLQKDVALQRRNAAAMGAVHLHCGSFAVINLKTVDLMHKTIIDNLMLLRRY